MPPLQAPCKRCGEPVEFDPEYCLGNHTLAVYCQKCIRFLEAERQAQFAAFRRRQLWLKVCPARFRDTIPDKLPCPEKSWIALDHEFKDGQGLNLWGLPDTGKTRTLYLVAQRLITIGRKVRVFTPAEFMAELEARDFKRGMWIKTLASYDTLAFDDLDKLPLTGPQEKALFALLDKRMAEKRPCIFTHNSTAEKLELAFKTGVALTRRIRQFTKSIHFP